MQIMSVNYSRLVNLGDYENEKIGAAALVEDGEMPEQTLCKLKKWVSDRAGVAHEHIGKIEELKEQRGDLEFAIAQLRRRTGEMIEKAREINAALAAMGIQPPDGLQNAARYAIEQLGENPQGNLPF